MSRLAVMITQLRLFPHELELPFSTTLRETGNYHGGHGFTACHFFLPEEFREAFEDKGMKIVAMAGLEGLGSHQPQQVNRLARNQKRWKRWLETHHRTCTHPSVVGLSEHMLIVAKKP
jgi:sugar phosphate isomerase/epimerase